MKTKFKNLFLLAIILLTPDLVHAESSCSYSEQAELNNIVANVKANYEVVDIYGGKTIDIDKTGEEIDYYIKGFNISVMNITEDIYVKVSNNYDEEVKTYHYADTQDGVASFQTENVDDLIDYKVEIFSNKYSCAGEKFREITLTTPVYNIFSEWRECIENPDFYYCQEFIPYEVVSTDNFRKQLEQYKTAKEEERKKEENKSFIEKIKDFYKDNALVIDAIGIVIVVMGVTTAVILIKRKRSRVL